jgi:hypothetical protein
MDLLDLHKDRRVREPRRDHHIEPVASTDTRAALAGALDRPPSARNLDGTDTATAVHLLASLAAEIEDRMSEAVTKARHHGCSGAGIADLLDATTASAWQRWRRPQAEGTQVGQPPRQLNQGPPKHTRGAPGRMSLGPDQRLDRPLGEANMSQRQQYQGFRPETGPNEQTERIGV